MNYCSLLILCYMLWIFKRSCFSKLLSLIFPCFLTYRSPAEHSPNVCARWKGRIITYEHLTLVLVVMSGMLWHHLTGRGVPTEQSCDSFWDKNCRRRQQWPGSGSDMIAHDASPYPILCRSVSKHPRYHQCTTAVRLMFSKLHRWSQFVIEKKQLNFPEHYRLKK